MLTTIVKNLTALQKDQIVQIYRSKQKTIKDIAKDFDTSPRTIGRVLEERGLATPVPRLKGEAYRVMKVLEGAGIGVDDLIKIIAQCKPGEAPMPISGHFSRDLAELYRRHPVIKPHPSQPFLRNPALAA